MHLLLTRLDIEFADAACFFPQRGVVRPKRTEDQAALRCKSGPRRRRRGNTSYKDEIHVGGSVILERLYIVRR